MNITREEWTRIAGLSGSALKARVFEVLQEASRAFHTDAFNLPQTLEVIPRLADIVPKRPELASYREPLSALARPSGLWNYIDKEAATEADVLLAESVSLPELDGVTLHREQVEALNDLLA